MLDILNALATEGYVTPGEMASVRSTSRHLGESIVRTLRSLNIASSEEIQECFQRYFGFPPLSQTVIESLNHTYQSLLPVDLAYQYSVFATKSENDRLYIAIEDPLDKNTIQQLAFFTNMKIVPLVATVEQLVQGLNLIYGWRPEETRLITLIESSRGVFPGNPNETLDESPFAVQHNVPQVWDGSQPDLSGVQALGSVGTEGPLNDSAKEAFLIAVMNRSDEGSGNVMGEKEPASIENEASEGSALDFLRNGFEDSHGQPSEQPLVHDTPSQPRSLPNPQPLLGRLSAAWAVKSPLMGSLEDLERFANSGLEIEGYQLVFTASTGFSKPTLMWNEQKVWESQGIEKDRVHPLGRFFVPLSKRANELGLGKKDDMSSDF